MISAKISTGTSKIHGSSFKTYKLRNVQTLNPPPVRSSVSIDVIEIVKANIRLSARRDYGHIFVLLIHTMYMYA